MRLLVRLIVLFAVVWCGWWAIASYGVSRGIDAWAAARTEEGWQVDVETSQGGFPFNIRTEVGLLDVANPVTGRAFSMEGGTYNAPTYWPVQVDVDLPETPILFRGPTGEAALTAQDATAAMRLRPGLALELRQIEVNAATWLFQSGGMEVLTGAGFELRADQTEKGSAQYDLTFGANGLVVSDALRSLLALPDSLPETFEIFAATGSVTFDAPLSNVSTEESPPRFTQIAIDGADVVWGDIVLEAAGAIDIDPTGMPEGALDLQARDWRNLLDLAQRAGILPSERRGQAELMFGLLAGRAGNREDLDLELAFENGRMSLSGIPLGPAPSFVFE